jgi:hypothetical protein
MPSHVQRLNTKYPESPESDDAPQSEDEPESDDDPQSDDDPDSVECRHNRYKINIVYFNATDQCTNVICIALTTSFRDFHCVETTQGRRCGNDDRSGQYSVTVCRRCRTVQNIVRNERGRS